MKNKISTVFILMLLFTSTPMLQAADGNGANGLLGDKTRLGINFNPILSWVRAPGAQTDNKGVRGGFQAGLQIDRYFATNYGFSTGIYFDYLGANINYNLPDSAGNARPFSHQYTTQFLEVPIDIFSNQSQQRKEL
jgi:hypothetical protein